MLRDGDGRMSKERVRERDRNGEREKKVIIIHSELNSLYLLHPLVKINTAAAAAAAMASCLLAERLTEVMAADQERTEEDEKTTNVCPLVYLCLCVSLCWFVARNTLIHEWKRRLKQGSTFLSLFLVGQLARVVI